MNLKYLAQTIQHQCANLDFWNMMTSFDKWDFWGSRA